MALARSLTRPLTQSLVRGTLTDEFSGGHYLSLPGTSGSYVSTPDSSPLSITGDIDIRVCVALNDWSTSTPAPLVNKLGSAGNRSYSLRAISGNLQLQWSSDGTTILDSSSATLSITAGAKKFIRATLAVIGTTVTFYTSDDGVTWTMLGSPAVTGGTTSIFDSALAVSTRDPNNVANLISGKLYSLEIRNGINGTIVASPDFTTKNPGITSFTDTQGNVWTLNGSAAIV